MTWKQDFRKIVTALLGLGIAGSGGFFLYLEMSSPPAHSAHVFTFAGFIAVGMLIVAPGVIGSAIKQALGYLPSVTLSGGRRDPVERPKDSE